MDSFGFAGDSIFSDGFGKFYVTKWELPLNNPENNKYAAIPYHIRRTFGDMSPVSKR